MDKRERDIFEICKKGGEDKIEDKIEREKKIIEETIEILKRKLKKKRLTRDEVVAISKYIYDTYTGIENILKILLKQRDRRIPDTPTWHRDLLESSYSSGIISYKLLTDFQELLGFRHLVAHGYGVALHKQRVMEICKKTTIIWEKFKKEIFLF